MKQERLISVIIPAYNVDKYLGRCLDSVLGQTYDNLEVLLVDDGSTDSTEEICDRYAGKDPRIHVIHKENAGVSAARNDALNMACGELIAFADADDHYEPDMLECLYNKMTEYDADMAVCGYYEEYPDRIVERGTGLGDVLYNRHQAYEDYFKMGGRIGSGCWNKLIKAEAIKGIRYKKYSMGEDVELLSRVIDRCDRIICTDHPGYHYIHREDSATQSSFRPANMDIIYVCEEMEEYVRNKHPELIMQFYGFHAAWHVATLQVLKKSNEFSKHNEEKQKLKNNIKESMKYYRNNKYVYWVDRILMRSYLCGLFVPAQQMYEILMKIRGKKIL